MLSQYMSIPFYSKYTICLMQTLGDSTWTSTWGQCSRDIWVISCAEIHGEAPFCVPWRKLWKMWEQSHPATSGHVAVLWICWGLKKILAHRVNLGRNQSVWWFQIFFIFNPIWGKWSNLTNIFQMGWNHHLAVCFSFLSSFLQANPCEIHLAVAAAQDKYIVQCQGSLTRGKNCHPLSMELPKWTIGISLDKCHHMPKFVIF